MNYAILGILLAATVFIIFLISRFKSYLQQLKLDGVASKIEYFEKTIEKIDGSTRDALAKAREEQTSNLKQTREEISNSFKSFSDSLLSRLSEISNMHKNQLDTFAKQLVTFNEDFNSNSKHLRDELSQSFKSLGDLLGNKLTENSKSQSEQLDIFSKQLKSLTESSDSKMEKMKETIEKRLDLLRQDNAQKLEQMRSTVDEKLQGTLEKRLGESFKQVSDRLELVYKGLGEMQTLATGVGDLKKVLTNIKTRGTWGEVQLGNLLEQVLSPEQYSKNVCVKPGSRENVEYAIKLPGRTDNPDSCVWLSMDSSFPQEDYYRLVDAQEKGSLELIEEATKQLEASVKRKAKEIKEKYISPPHTTDFGILFLPAEGLFAEVLRRPKLCEVIQREYRIVIAGPTTLAAFLNSLQMGFRTLAVEKRSSEVWAVLGAVKTEFGKFGGILEKVERKLKEATNTIGDAAQKSRTIERKLRNVETLSPPESEKLLGGVDEVIPEPSEVNASVDGEENGEVPF